jgi:hypothetical protein
VGLLALTRRGLEGKRNVSSGVDCWGKCVQVGVLIYLKTTTYRAETPAGRALILQIGPSRAPWARVGTCVCLTTVGAAASNVRGGAIRKGKCKRADWIEVARWGVCGRPQLVWVCACVARIGRTRRRDVRPRAGRDAGRNQVMVGVEVKEKRKVEKQQRTTNTQERESMRAMHACVFREVGRQESGAHGQ